MEPVRKQIAENIRNFRKEKGLSAEDVGAAVGKSGKTISAWERGQGQPDADELIALCILFGVEISDFYYRQTSGYSDMSSDEETLISYYRGMNEQGKAALLASAEGLYQAFRVKNNQVSRTA